MWQTIILDYARFFTRWTHLISVFFWIGTTLYLGRMARFTVATPYDPVSLARVHGIHGGRVWLYVMLRHLPPSSVRLHWFKWESLVAWGSGLLLLILNFWVGETASRTWAGAFGLMIAGTLAYRLIWSVIKPNSPYEIIGVLISLLNLMGFTWLFGLVLDPYRTYYHVAGTLATIMAIQNVWLTIMPAQRRMVQQGGQVDEELAARAMRCTRHNVYIMPTVVALMTTMHHPAVLHVGEHSWLAVGVIAVVGGCTGHALRKWL